MPEDLAFPSDPEAASPEAASPRVAPLSLPSVGTEQFATDTPGNLHVLRHVELEVSVELGRRRLPLADVLRLGAGSVVELEKLVGEPLLVYANGRLIAEGEAVVVDEQFGVRILRLAGAAEAA
jgi:flagellar motor switch protein FliN